MTNDRDLPPRAALALDDDPAPRSSGAALVVDDEPQPLPARTGLVIDDGPATSPQPAVREPLKLLDEDAIVKAARGMPALAVVLGIDEHDVVRADDAQVRTQAKLFRERWVALEKRKAVLQEIKKDERVAPWLFVIDVLAGRADASVPPASPRWVALLQELPRLTPGTALIRTMDHQRALRMEELVSSARAFVVNDRILQWNERQDLDQIAESLAFGEREIDEAMRRVEKELRTPIARESEAEWKARQPKGEWEPHDTLGGGDDAWDLARLRAALQDPDRFDEAIEVARGSNAATALTTYLRHQRGGKAYLQAAIEAERLGSSPNRPVVAVWGFLWRTGEPKELHVTGAEHRPTREPSRRVASIAELHALVKRAWVIDRLGHALDDGLLAAWLACIGADSSLAGARHRAGGDREATRRHSVIEILWRTGFRGLPLRADDGGCAMAQAPDDVVSQSPDCGRYLEQALASGLLESWLAQIGSSDLSRAAASIRQDSRGLKLYRWLQTAGYKHYDVGGHQVDSPEAFADLPHHDVSLETIWEHIREGVPQARFARLPQIVAILEGVRTAPELHDAARGLIACLRLGLRALPVPMGEVVWVTQPAELATILRADKGREALDVLLRTRVLEAWMEAIEAGAGRRAAGARDLPPEVAVDRALRPWLGEVFPIGGLRAASFETLQALALDDVVRLCGDAGARQRIRDALVAVPLAGSPGLRDDATEALLAELPAPHAAMRFAWHVLRCPILHVGATKVTSVEQLLAVLATQVRRSIALELATSGFLVAWATEALGLRLDATLYDVHGRVAPEMFSALCLELGEQPPAVAIKFRCDAPGPPARIPEGAILPLRVTFTNADLIRGASVVLTPSTSQPIGAFVDPTTLVPRDSIHVDVPPGATVEVPLQFASHVGRSGPTTLAVTAEHARPQRQPPFSRGALDVVVQFPRRDVAVPAVLWLLVATAVFLVFRFGLVQAEIDPLLGIEAVPDGATWLLGLGAMLLFGGGIAVRARFWRHIPPITTLVAVSMVGYFAYWVGRLALFAIRGIDLIGLRLCGASAVDALAGRRVTTLGTQACWGWALTGAVLGVAWGLAIGLRSVNRGRTGEVIRAVLVLGLVGLALLGPP